DRTDCRMNPLRPLLTLTRRQFVQLLGMLGTVPSVGTVPRVEQGGLSPGRSPQRLWYSTAANAWVEALPIGNGSLGAMVFGGVGRERLQLNDDTLWSGAPRNWDNPKA